MNQHLAKDLAGLGALDETGAKVPLGGFWADRPAVLALVRYFDSASCRKLVGALRDSQTDIDKRGARLVIVGPVKPGLVAEFREAVNYRGPLVVDPSLDVFRAALMLPGAAPKPAAPAPAKPESTGFFGHLKIALNADVGKLAKMNVMEALTVDLEKLAVHPPEPEAPAAPAKPVTAHDMAVLGFAPKDVVTFEWRSHAAGDMPRIAELIASIK
jgi:hypothetical protein